MDFEKLFALLQDQPKYRINQVKTAIYKDLADDWQKVLTLPIGLRTKLNQECPLKINARIFTAANQPVAKALITLADGVKIETVLLTHEDGRRTVCVSSQAGCPLGCKFCATGQMGFTRNLTASEIVEQVLFFARYLKQLEISKLKLGIKNLESEFRITNIVMMGMGEPFLNYDNVIRAIRFLNEDTGLDLGARRFSLSTVGIVEGIRKLSKEKLQVNLAISLHATNDQLRTQLMPVNKKYPLNLVLKAVADYIKITKRKVMFEYLMINGVNDSLYQAKALACLVKKPLMMVNLIAYNPTDIFKPSTSLRIKKFREILEKEGVLVTQRYSFGRELSAACGQLAASK